MNTKRDTAELASESDDRQSSAAPFLYEIRVKGRLSNERWTSWFEESTVTAAGGESILRGRVPDHAALYGLLGRLRDLAVPLVAVRVLDSEAQLKLRRQGRRFDLLINGLLVLTYLLLLGGLSALAILASQAINVALALTILFAALGGLAHAFWLWSAESFWRWVAYGGWIGAAITFLVYIPVSGLLPTALGLAILLFLLAGGVLFVLYQLRRRAEELHSRTVAGQPEEVPHATDPTARTEATSRPYDGPQE